MTKIEMERLRRQDSPRWVRVLKTTIRPVLTYVFSVVYLLVLFIPSIALTDKEMDGLNAVMVTIIVFWFGDRMLDNVGQILDSINISEYFKNKFKKDG